MRINRIETIFFVIIILISSFLLTDISFAQQDKIIITIRVKDNKAISESTILSKIKSKPGDKFSQDILNDDLKRLYALGYFTDVSMDVEDYKEGVMVTIIVEEKPLINEIIFEGNKKIGTRRLEKAMQTKVGDMLNYSKLAQDITELKNLYGQQGFQMVDIRYEIEKDEKANAAAVKIIIDEKKRVRIKKVHIQGNKSVPTKTILNMMKTKPAWLLSRGYLDEEALEGDLERIKWYYQDLGFLDVGVSKEFEYDEKNKLMFITIKIDEKKRYIMGKTEISGNIVLAKEDIKNLIKAKEGEPFSYNKLRTDMEAIKEHYFEKGYMNVEIDADRKIDPETNRIDVIYVIDAHEVVYVGRIDIKGNTKTKDIVIRRELRIFPGEKFDGEKIKRSKERLYNLGFFEDIYLDTEETQKPNVRNLLVSVKETKTGEFAFGGGYSSIDEFIGFAQITQRNFDLFNFPYFTGDGQNLSVRANFGTIRRDFEVSWTEPWILDYPLSFGFDAYHRTHSRKSTVGYGYKELRMGGDLRLGKEFGEYLRGDLMYKLEEVDISDLSSDATKDLVDESGENWISSLMLGMSFDTRDNVYSPKKGILTELVLENAGGFLGFDKDFYKVFFTTSYYYSLFDKLFLELKGRTGFCNSYGDTEEVPIYERFFAGGAYTIRGYRERRVGPRDPGSSDPIGGETMAIGNAELTFPIYEKIIKGAVFYDVGNVWRRMEDYFDGGFMHGVGAGIRVKTPIGPLKLDAGYPLSDNQGDEKKIEWYFSVSHGF